MERQGGFAHNNLSKQTNRLQWLRQGSIAMLRFVVSNKRERQQFEHHNGPIEFGRGPERQDVPRCVIQDLYVSKDHVQIEETDEGAIHVRNLSARNSIRLSDNSIISTGETRVIAPPLRMMVGETIIDMERLVDPVANAPLSTIAAPKRPAASDSVAVNVPDGSTLEPPPPNAPGAPAPPKPATESSSGSISEMSGAPKPEDLMEWFETLIAVQRSAAGSPEFYEQTAQAVVRLIGLDRGLVILRPSRSHALSSAPNSALKERWVIQARYPDEDNVIGREFSMTILDRVLQDRRTYFQSTASSSTSAESLQGVEAVVASPIFDSQDNIIGFVYGSRNRFTRHRGIGISNLEAQVVQLLASSVGVGLARQHQEAEAGRARIQFEQFFSADLAQALQRNPDLLKGTMREITVLFSDIRGFSRISEKLDPTETCELVSDVMDRLTARVRDFDGVVVDYAGDGLMAMWNAPLDQPDHAVRACHAALAMLGELPRLDQVWQPRIGVPLRFGIGINSGPAMCGNTGSRIKFKYGPLGHTVNLASRVESATKQMGVPLMITGSTQQQISDQFAVRRLGQVQVVGIHQPVDFFELHAEEAEPEWAKHRDAYERALALYEAGKFGDACRVVYPILAGQEGHYDVPSLNLVMRSVEGIKDPPNPFDGVLKLPEK